MSTIRRSELVAGDKSEGGGKMGIKNNNEPDLKKTSSSLGRPHETASSNNTTTSNNNNNNKLVFGLNARTNKVKHDEYVEQRLKGSRVLIGAERESKEGEKEDRVTNSANCNTARGLKKSDEQASAQVTHTGGNKTNAGPAPQKGPSGVVNAPGASGVTSNTGPAFEQEPSKRKGIRASKYGNFYKPQDLNQTQAELGTQKQPERELGQTSQGVVATSEVKSRGEQETSRETAAKSGQKAQQALGAKPSGPATSRVASAQTRQGKQVGTREAASEKDKRGQEGKRIESSERSSSPASSRQQMGGTKSTDERRKSDKSLRGQRDTRGEKTNQIQGGEKSSETTKGAPLSDKEKRENKDEEEEEVGQEQQVVVKARTQFNILPPPQLAMATTGRGSVVSYAKSRIYDKPREHILSNPPFVVISGQAMGAPLFLHQAGHIPQAILSGRKPPKQVNVSRARKEWEGGEPFAKCRSRKRLAAAQRNKNKLLIHESWSMASVVATQQMQLQQALAASSSTYRSNVHQSDPSVKVLTAGSVLERVQQFERAPSSGSLSSNSGSSSSLSSGSSWGENFDGDSNLDEAVVTIDGVADRPRPLSPGSSKQAAYKSKVSSLQQQQRRQSSGRSGEVEQQSQQRGPTVGGGLVSGPPDSRRGADGRRLSQTGASGPMKRRLSFVRKPSSASLIPKFYHPHGTKPNTYDIELERRNIVACFDKFPDASAQVVGPNSKKHFHSIALACGFSEYFKIPLLIFVKHLLDTKADLFSEAKLGQNERSALASLSRRRSSLLALNPNNVRLPQEQKALTGSPSVRSKQPLLRSNSHQQIVETAQSQPIGTTTSASKEEKKTNGKSNPLHKSASIDTANKGMSARHKESIQVVSCEQFLICWKHLINQAYDLPARFVFLLTLGQRDYLLPDDFVPLVQSVIDDHPGLKFLRAAPDFHLRYIETVVARIYYNINLSWTGKITLQELRRSNLLPVLQVLSSEEDINQITDYFSYEHFYVIYCKFWSLDQDHDLLISKEDLARHQDASISARIIDRIFSGIVSKQIARTGKMSYSDFVWFLIAEEDKKHRRAIEYWFRLMDLDGDGFISMYELEYFYYEQMKRLELMNIEALPFLDTACQILDLINPKEKNKISLADLKRTKMATIFFDTFINLEKYLEHESREFVSTRDIVQDGVVISDWERYASEEYENMVTEETSV